MKNTVWSNALTTTETPLEHSGEGWRRQQDIRYWFRSNVFILKHIDTRCWAVSPKVLKSRCFSKMTSSILTSCRVLEMSPMLSLSRFNPPFGRNSVFLRDGWKEILWRSSKASDSDLKTISGDYPEFSSCQTAVIKTNVPSHSHAGN